MKILIGCEYSGRVRNAFRQLGHDAYSCDLLDSEDESDYHFKDDVFKVIESGWDMAIFHPPCTYLAASGLHWNGRIPGRALLTVESLEFVRRLFLAPIEKIALENPVGCISSEIRKPDQIIQPWMFGEDASKATCLWLKNLPKLKGTNTIPGRSVEGKLRWANQTNSGQNNLSPGLARWKERSRTYQGIADAMAEQWA